jgi:hypothetical protein
MERYLEKRLLTLSLMKQSQLLELTEGKQENQMATEKPNASYSKETKDTPVVTPKTMRTLLLEDQLAHPALYVRAHLPGNIDDPLPDPPVLTPLTPEEQKRADAKAEVLKQIGEILKQYGDRESEVPAASPYWSLLAQYRGM